MVAAGVVSACHHGLKLIKELLTSEERHDQLEELILVEDALDIAVEALNDVVIVTLIWKRYPQLFEELALALREGLKLMALKLRLVGGVMMMG